MYTQRSRFIPEAILGRFTIRIWPQAGATAATAAGVRRRVDLGAKMRARWG
jgi:hypothetical protein